MKLLIVALLAVLAVTAYNVISSYGGFAAVLGLEQPYASDDDLERRGVPAGSFAMTQYNKVFDDTLMVICYTYGKPDDLKYVRTYTNRIKHLFRYLRNNYNVRLIIYKGSPARQGETGPAYTGEILSETVFERYAY